MKEDEPNQQQKGNYFRKQLTRKRLANIIEISLVFYRKNLSAYMCQ